MSDADGAFAGGDQSFEQIVDAQIAGSTGQNAITTLNRLADQFDQCRRLARSWWTVDHGDMFGR